MTLGAYPDVSLAEARQKRDQARILLVNEVDPSDTKKAQKAAGTQDINEAVIFGLGYPRDGVLKLDQLFPNGE